jgi:hypothetical protein
MLERILRYLRNWFVASVHTGDFSVENGSITLPFLREGQHYRIIGSTLNDGVHRYGDGQEMPNEEFSGEIWALAVPPSLLETVEKIEKWEAKNAEAAHSPYQSESFGGYSYTKKNGVGWESAFRSELSVWRKL